jgi:hypothetical protein
MTEFITDNVKTVCYHFYAKADTVLFKKSAQDLQLFKDCYENLF